MISDEMLQQAAAEYSQTLEDSVAEYAHDFSPRFHSQMASVFRRARHPVGYRVARQCAAAVLVLLTLFGSLVMFSPDARAAAFGWLQEVIEDDIIFRPAESTTANMPCEYHLTEVPEGYELIDVLENNASKTYVYLSGERLLHFSFSRSNSSTTVGFSNLQKYDYHPYMLGNNLAGIYLAPQSGENNVIIWIDTENLMLISISADVTMEELIAMAESVEKNK